MEQLYYSSKRLIERMVGLVVLSVFAGTRTGSRLSFNIGICDALDKEEAAGIENEALGVFISNASWRFLRNDKLLACSDDILDCESTALKNIQSTKNAVITQVSINEVTLDLVMQFSSEILLQVFCSNSDCVSYSLLDIDKAFVVQTLHGKATIVLEM